jgi:hypothetical protein
MDLHYLLSNAATLTRTPKTQGAFRYTGRKTPWNPLAILSTGRFGKSAENALGTQNALCIAAKHRK